jgi:hypothetical protein
MRLVSVQGGLLAEGGDRDGAVSPGTAAAELRLLVQRTSENLGMCLCLGTFASPNHALIWIGHSGHLKLVSDLLETTFGF